MQYSAHPKLERITFARVQKYKFSNGLEHRDAFCTVKVLAQFFDFTFQLYFTFGKKYNNSFCQNIF